MRLSVGIRNFPIQREISSHHIVLSGQARNSFSSGQAWNSFSSGPLPPKSYPKRAEFPISRFNVKNWVSSGRFSNQLSPVKAKKKSR